MGMIIFTNDDSKYQQGNFLMMYDVLDISPSRPDMTYILRTKKFTEQDIEFCLPKIQNRLVISMEKIPRLSKKIRDLVLIDEAKNNRPSIDMKHGTNVILKEKDRLRAYVSATRVPVPYALSFVKANITDINFHRRLAKIGVDLDDCYTHALLAFGFKPLNGRIQWPNKKKAETEIPPPFRESDKYRDEIIAGDVGVANNLRIQAKELLPKGVKKTRQAKLEWV